MRTVLFLGLLMIVSLLNAQQSYIDEVQWTNGFWAERYDQTKETILLKLWDLAVDPAAGRVLENFRVAAKGMGETAGMFWQDAWK